MASGMTTLPAAELPPVKDLDRTPKPAINKITKLQYIFMRITYHFICTVLTIRSWRFFNPHNQPSYTKKQLSYLYPTRIFLPPSFHSSPGKTYPLVCNIHGGGWFMGLPAMEDSLAKPLAAMADCVVACLDYRKSPKNPFPAAQEDLAVMIPQLVKDPALRVDPKKLFLAGGSAGGNLALTMSLQGSLPTLDHPVAGTLAMYPSCDVADPLPNKIASRNGEPDMLAVMATMMLRAYVPVGQDLKNPRISPGYYHHRSDLPQRMYVLGAERDMLMPEAKRLAERLAGADQRTPYSDAGWQAQGVYWDLAVGQKHGFNFMRARGDAEVERKRIVQLVYSNMATFVNQ